MTKALMLAQEARHIRYLNRRKMRMHALVLIALSLVFLIVLVRLNLKSKYVMSGDFSIFAPSEMPTDHNWRGI